MRFNCSKKKYTVGVWAARYSSVNVNGWGLVKEKSPLFKKDVNLLSFWDWDERMLSFSCQCLKYRAGVRKLVSIKTENRAKHLGLALSKNCNFDIWLLKEIYPGSEISQFQKLLNSKGWVLNTWTTFCICIFAKFEWPIVLILHPSLLLTFSSQVLPFDWS